MTRKNGSVKSYPGVLHSGVFFAGLGIFVLALLR
jgi:hypothetical protein